MDFKFKFVAVQALLVVVAVVRDTQLVQGQPDRIEPPGENHAISESAGPQHDFYMSQLLSTSTPKPQLDFTAQVASPAFIRSQIDSKANLNPKHDSTSSLISQVAYAPSRNPQLASVAYQDSKLTSANKLNFQQAFTSLPNSQLTLPSMQESNTVPASHLNLEWAVKTARELHLEKFRPETDYPSLSSPAIAPLVVPSPSELPLQNFASPAKSMSVPSGSTLPLRNYGSVPLNLAWKSTYLHGDTRKPATQNFTRRGVRTQAQRQNLLELISLPGATGYQVNVHPRNFPEERGSVAENQPSNAIIYEVMPVFQSSANEIHESDLRRYSYAVPNASESRGGYAHEIVPRYPKKSNSIRLHLNTERQLNTENDGFFVASNREQEMSPSNDIFSYIKKPNSSFPLDRSEDVRNQISITPIPVIISDGNSVSFENFGLASNTRIGLASSANNANISSSREVSRRIMHMNSAGAEAPVNLVRTSKQNAHQSSISPARNESRKFNPEPDRRPPVRSHNPEIEVATVLQNHNSEAEETNFSRSQDTETEPTTLVQTQNRETGTTLVHTQHPETQNTTFIPNQVQVMPSMANIPPSKSSSTAPTVPFMENTPQHTDDLRAENQLTHPFGEDLDPLWSEERPELSTLYERMENSARYFCFKRKISDFEHLLSPNGSFTDLQYTRDHNALRDHGRRLCALVYQSLHQPTPRTEVEQQKEDQGQRFPQRQNLPPEVLSSFQFLAFDAPLPPSRNWWQHIIGTPSCLWQGIFLARKSLPRDLVTSLLDKFWRRGQAGPVWDLAATDGSMAGGNLGPRVVLGAVEAALRGGLPGWRGEAAGELQREAVYRDGRGENGIRPDGCIHQHNLAVPSRPSVVLHQMYSINYGKEFFRHIGVVLWWFHETPASFGPALERAVVGAFLQCQVWLHRGAVVEPSSTGRFIDSGRLVTRVGAQDAIERAVRALGRLEHAPEELQAALHRYRSATPLPHLALKGHRHFYSSDLSVHHRPHYFAGVRLTSSRSVRPEAFVSGANAGGYFQGDGWLSIIASGQEFGSMEREVFQAYDWWRVPGVTSPCERGPLEQVPFNARWAAHFTNTARFVGGATDGDVGAAAMLLNRSTTPLTARKSWHFFSDAVVALASDISSSGEAIEVVTTLNQVLSSGPITVGLWAGGQTAHPPTAEAHSWAAQWVHHDSMAYVLLPTPSGGVDPPLWVRNESRAIPGGAALPVFTSWMSHGVQPTAAHYSYAYLPTPSAQAAAHYAAHPTASVLSNTAGAHVVCGHVDQTASVVLWTAGQADISGCLPASLLSRLRRWHASTNFISYDENYDRNSMEKIYLKPSGDGAYGRTSSDESYRRTSSDKAYGRTSPNDMYGRTPSDGADTRIFADGTYGDRIQTDRLHPRIYSNEIFFKNFPSVKYSEAASDRKYFKSFPNKNYSKRSSDAISFESLVQKMSRSDTDEDDKGNSEKHFPQFGRSPFSHPFETEGEEERYFPSIGNDGGDFSPFRLVIEADKGVILIIKPLMAQEADVNQVEIVPLSAESHGGASDSHAYRHFKAPSTGRPQELEQHPPTIVSLYGAFLPSTLQRQKSRHKRRADPFADLSPSFTSAHPVRESTNSIFKSYSKGFDLKSIDSSLKLVSPDTQNTSFQLRDHTELNLPSEPSNTLFKFFNFTGFIPLFKSSGANVRNQRLISDKIVDKYSSSVTNFSPAERNTSHTLPGSGSTRTDIFQGYPHRYSGSNHNDAAPTADQGNKWLQNEAKSGEKILDVNIELPVPSLYNFSLASLRDQIERTVQTVITETEEELRHKNAQETNVPAAQTPLVMPQPVRKDNMYENVSVTQRVFVNNSEENWKGLLVPKTNRTIDRSKFENEVLASEVSEFLSSQGTNETVSFLPIENESRNTLNPLHLSPHGQRYTYDTRETDHLSPHGQRYTYDTRETDHFRVGNLTTGNPSAHPRNSNPSFNEENMDKKVQAESQVAEAGRDDFLNPNDVIAPLVGQYLDKRGSLNRPVAALADFPANLSLTSQLRYGKVPSFTYEVNNKIEPRYTSSGAPEDVQSPGNEAGISVDGTDLKMEQFINFERAYPEPENVANYAGHARRETRPVLCFNISVADPEQVAHHVTVTLTLTSQVQNQLDIHLSEEISHSTRRFHYSTKTKDGKENERSNVVHTSGERERGFGSTVYESSLADGLVEGGTPVWPPEPRVLSSKTASIELPRSPHRGSSVHRVICL